MDNIYQQAAELGMDHAEQENNTGQRARLHSGREIAVTLGLGRDLTGEEYVALRDAYDGGWSNYF